MVHTNRFLGFLFILIVACPAACGQATAELSGSLTNPTGALLPGVEITATQTDTGISRTVLSNETGAYVMTNLPTGPYRLEAVLPGFQSFVQTGIVLQVNSSPVINVVMEVGQVTQTVEVVANTVLVETRNTAIGSFMENERILELPLDGRNVTDLITLAGGGRPVEDDFPKPSRRLAVGRLCRGLRFCNGLHAGRSQSRQFYDQYDDVDALSGCDAGVQGGDQRCRYGPAGEVVSGGRGDEVRDQRVSRQSV